MVSPMLRFLSAAALILALVTSPVTAAPEAPPPPDAALRADLHCAAAFAIAVWRGGPRVDDVAFGKRHLFGGGEQESEVAQK